jgi:hypothetical protein
MTWTVRSGNAPGGRWGGCRRRPPLAFDAKRSYVVAPSAAPGRTLASPGWSFYGAQRSQPSQPVADALAPETAKISESVAVGCQRLPGAVHGKEGVGGSSPSEGSRFQAGSRLPFLALNGSRPSLYLA